MRDQLTELMDAHQGGLMQQIAEAEQVLEALIREHGVQVVRRNLGPLMKQFNWSTWQRARSLVHNVNARIQREKKTNGKKKHNERIR